MTDGFLHSAWVGLTRNMAFTEPNAEDRRLRGRTYAIPFDDVWRASVSLVAQGLSRWELRHSDDQEGIIRGEVHGRLKRFDSLVTIRITLDMDAQTRVDALVAAREGRGDMGTSARRLRRFFSALDRELERVRGRTIESARLA